MYVNGFYWFVSKRERERERVSYQEFLFEEGGESECPYRQLVNLVQNFLIDCPVEKSLTTGRCEWCGQSRRVLTGPSIPFVFICTVSSKILFVNNFSWINAFKHLHFSDYEHKLISTNKRRRDKDRDPRSCSLFRSYCRQASKF